MSLEKNDILAALRDTGATITATELIGGNISRAAHKLGVARRTLQARMRHYKIPAGRAGRRKKKMSYGRLKRGYAAVAAVIAGGKKKYGRSTRGYAVAAAALVVGGALLLRRKQTST